MSTSFFHVNLCSVLAASVLAAVPVVGAEARPLVCRAVEEFGRVTIGEPAISYAHVVTLFAVDKRPTPGEGSYQDHLDWVNDPLHTCVADGTGALAVLAHPSVTQAEWIASLEGLTGMEMHYAGEAASRDALWDDVLRRRCAAGRPPLWAFAADDTHSRTRINLSWYAALLPRLDEHSLKAALRAGALYVSNGPTIERVAVTGTRIALDLGQPSEVLWLRAGQYNQPGGSFTVGNATGACVCLQRDEGVTRSEVDLAALGVPLNEMVFVRAIARTSATSEALTQPFLIDPDGRIRNPYPASGLWVRGQTHNHVDSSIQAHLDGDAPVHAFRKAYRDIGQEASFALEYSYWEVPLGRPASDGFPDLTAVAPDRLPAGRAGTLRVTGVNFQAGLAVQLGARRLEDVVVESPTALRVVLPGDLPAGVYDLVVTNPDGFRGALCDGFTVQDAAASLAGWTTFGPPELPWPQTITLAVFGEALWAGTMHGAARYVDERWETVLPGEAIYGMAALPDGGVALAVGSGVRIVDAAGQVHAEKVGNGAKNERWGCMAVDAEGRCWAGGRWGNGLARRGADGVWTLWTQAADGLPSSSCHAMIRADDGVMWVGFSNGLCRRVGEAWEKVALPPELGRSPSCLTRGPDGAIWVAALDAERGGVACLRPDGTAQAITAPPLPSPRISAVLAARDGSVWFASRRGVARRDAAGVWQTFTTRNSGLAWDAVMALAEDSRGRIWMATGRGLSRFDPAAVASVHP